MMGRGARSPEAAALRRDVAADAAGRAEIGAQAVVTRSRGRWNVALVLSAAALFGGLGAWDGGWAAWFLCYTLLVVGAYAVIAHAAGCRVAAVARVAEVRQGESGGELRVTVELKVRTVLPLARMTVAEPWLRNGELFVERKTLLFPGWRSSIRYEYAMAVPRGVYRSEVLTVFSGDLFGTTFRRTIRPSKVECAVWPAPYVRVGERTAAAGTAADPGASVRDYAPGDAPSAIHWKASAKGCGLKVKEPDRSAEESTLLLLDTSMDGPLLEHAVSVCAGELLAADPGRTVRVACLDRDDTVVCRNAAERGEGLRYLAAARACGKPYGAWVLRNGLAAERDAALCCIVSRFDFGLFDALRRLRLRGRKIEVIYAAPDAADAFREEQTARALETIGCAFRIVRANNGGAVAAVRVPEGAVPSASADAGGPEPL